MTCKMEYAIGVYYATKKDDFIKANEWYFLDHQMGDDDATRHYAELNGWY